MIRDFKEFALKGNALDLAVGIIIGAGFTKIVNSLVSDIIMPPLGLLTKSTDFVKTWGLELPIPGVGVAKILVGSFLDSVLQFLIVAFAAFLLVRAFNQLRKRSLMGTVIDSITPTTRECPFCISPISKKATRCPACTSELPPVS
jgi:large conductance mechanosensitive channel